MSNRIPANGLLTLTVAALDRVAIFSRAPVKVYQRAGFPNFPESWTLLQAVAEDTEYRSAAFAAGAVLRIEASEADVLYATGTGAVITERIGMRAQGAPGVLDATGALTVAMMVSGIVTSAAAAVTGTLPTGAVLDAALDMDIGESFDWSVIKVGANAFTLAVAAGHTIVGLLAIATATSTVLRTRKIAADTFETYRISG